MKIIFVIGYLSLAASLNAMKESTFEDPDRKKIRNAEGFRDVVAILKGKSFDQDRTVCLKEITRRFWIVNTEGRDWIVDKKMNSRRELPESFIFVPSDSDMYILYDSITKEGKVNKASTIDLLNLKKINGVAWNRAGTELFVNSADNMHYIVNVVSLKSRFLPSLPAVPLKIFQWSRDDSMIVCVTKSNKKEQATHDEVYCIDAKTCKKINTWDTPRNIIDAEWNQDGTSIAVMEQDPTDGAERLLVLNTTTKPWSLLKSHSLDMSYYKEGFESSDHVIPDLISPAVHVLRFVFKKPLQWSPDDNFLLFYTNEGQTALLFDIRHMYQLNKFHILKTFKRSQVVGCSALELICKEILTGESWSALGNIRLVAQGSMIYRVNQDGRLVFGHTIVAKEVGMDEKTHELCAQLTAAHCVILTNHKKGTPLDPTIPESIRRLWEK